MRLNKRRRRKVKILKNCSNNCRNNLILFERQNFFFSFCRKSKSDIGQVLTFLLGRIDSFHRLISFLVTFTFRYHISRNYSTFYVCHTDEHRTATVVKQQLKQKSTSPQICEKCFEVDAKVYKRVQIDCKFFGRASTEKQTTKCIHLKINEIKFLAKSILQFVKIFFWKLYNRNFLIFTNNVGLL